MPRRLKSWLAGYLEYTRHLPSPLRMRTWAGIGAISATLQRRVYTTLMDQVQFPNMYILLIGPPGVGKGVALKNAKELVQDVPNTHVAAQSLTRRTFYAELEASKEVAIVDDKTVIQSPLSAFIEEFGIFVRPGDYEFMYSLADAFDCLRLFEYKTQHAGEHHIENVCFSLLAACTPKILKQVMTEEALELGLGARTILVFSDEVIKSPLFPSHQKKEALYKDLSEDLRAIRELSGNYVLTPEAAEILEQWYSEDLAPIPSDPRFEHYNSRRLIQITKLIQILAASRSDDMAILPDDVRDAKEILLEAEAEMPRAIEMLGANPMLTQQQNAVKIINLHWKKTQRGYPEYKLRQMFSRDVPPQYVPHLLDSLERAKWITVQGQAPDRLYFPRGVQTSPMEKATQEKKEE